MSSIQQTNRVEPGSISAHEEAAQKFTSTYYKYWEATKEAEDCKRRYESIKEQYTANATVVGSPGLESVINSHEKWKYAALKADTLMEDLKRYSKDLEYYYEILGKKNFMIITDTHEFTYYMGKDDIMSFSRNSLC